VFSVHTPSILYGVVWWVLVHPGRQQWAFECRVLSTNLILDIQQIIVFFLYDWDYWIFFVWNVEIQPL
jgi:hypothetical protein